MAGPFPPALTPPFSTIPWEFPAVVLGVGFSSLTIGLLDSVVDTRRSSGTGTETGDGLYGTERRLVVTLVTVGVVFGAGSALLDRGLLWYYAMYLVVIGRVVEGGLLVRFFAKLFAAILSSGSDGTVLDSVLGFVRDRLVRVLLTGAVAVSMVVVVAVALLEEPLIVGLAWTALAYTVGDFGITAVVVIYQLGDVFDRLDDRYPGRGGLVLSGVVLLLAGAEVFDFPPFLGVVRIPAPVLGSPTGELLVRFGGWVGLLVGMGLGFVLLGRATVRNAPPQ